MICEIGQSLNENPRRARWAGRIGLVLESPELVFEVSECLGRIGADIAFRATVGAGALEVASLVEREQVDLVLVELARVKGGSGSGPGASVEGVAAQWIGAMRAGLDMPLIVAMDVKADPAVMIEAVRAGANEFLSLPAAPALYEALDRLTMVLEGRRAATQARGRMAGILSAKGGCGATTVACHLAAALRTGTGSSVLVADLDAQSSAAHRVLRVKPVRRASDAFANVRQLNAANWPEFTSSAGENPDLLAGWEAGGSDGPPLAEPWRIEGMFRFLSRNYGWVLADLGRNLNPAVWAFLQNLDELFVVTAPDVLALYQTRSILQTLAGRGFDKTRLHLILNRNNKGPRDFWIESIRKMFEMDVIAVIPEDQTTLDRLPRDRFEFPAASPFGRAVGKLAAHLTKGGPSPARNQARSMATSDDQTGRGRKEQGRKSP